MAVVSRVRVVLLSIAAPLVLGGLCQAARVKSSTAEKALTPLKKKKKNINIKKKNKKSSGGVVASPAWRTSPGSLPTRRTHCAGMESKPLYICFTRHSRRDDRVHSRGIQPREATTSPKRWFPDAAIERFGRSS